MKPFNLKKAKAGRPVCTRDGNEATIHCFDLTIFASTNYRILATYRDAWANKCFAIFDEQGKIESSEAGYRNNDLFMESTKKSAWMNLYLVGEHSNLYKTREDAVCNADTDRVLDTVEVHWEE